MEPFFDLMKYWRNFGGKVLKYTIKKAFNGFVLVMQELFRLFTELVDHTYRKKIRFCAYFC